MKRWLTVLTFVALATLCFASLTISAEKEPINQDWLDQDLKITSILKKHLPPSKADVNSFLRSVGAVGIESVDLGFGNLRYEGAIGGGYVSFNIKVLTRGDGIASMRIEMPLYGESPEVANRIQKRWGNLVTPYEYGIRYEYTNPSLYKEMLVALESALGNYENKHVGAQAKAYEILTDPFYTNDVGDICYYAGVEPEGRKAINVLKAAGRYDLIRGALRSMSPEGRVYAALALLELRGVIDITKADYKTINAIKRLNIDISVCEGCMVFTRKASEIIP